MCSFFSFEGYFRVERVLDVKPLVSLLIKVCHQFDQYSLAIVLLSSTSLVLNNLQILCQLKKFLFINFILLFQNTQIFIMKMPSLNIQLKYCLAVIKILLTHELFESWSRKANLKLVQIVHSCCKEKRELLLKRYSLRNVSFSLA